MNDRGTAQRDLFGRAGAFYACNIAGFAPGSNAATDFTALAGIVPSLDAAKAGQINTGVTAKKVLTDALRLDVQNIARTARAIAQDEPGFADDFRAPAIPSQAALLTTADNYLTHLAKPSVAAKFSANELPADFVADRAAIDEANDTVESEDNEGVESTAAVGRLIKAGMKEVNYLNAIMHNEYSRTSDKLVAWKSASHIERASLKAKTPTAVTSTSPE